MTALDAVTFGEAMSMFIAQQPGLLHEVNYFKQDLAGAESNTAIGLARLGFSAGWASKVGSDAFGTFIQQKLQKERVNMDHVLVDKQFPTGFQFKSKVLSGDPDVQYHRHGSAASRLGKSDVQASYFLKARHLHATGIPLALSSSMREFAFEVIRLMKENNKSVSFDPNLRPALWKTEKEMIETVNKAAVQADFVLPGIEEGQWLTGFSEPKDIADFYLDQGVSCVIVKLGSKGAFFKTNDEERFVLGYNVKKVVDTIGAGDGFAAGVISGILEGLSIEQSVQRGNAIGALTVQVEGDNEGYPTRRTLEDFINQQKHEVTNYAQNTR